MPFPSPLQPGKTATHLLFAGAAAFAPLHAQDFSLRLAGADRMFRDGILPENLASMFDPTFGGAIKGAASYSLSVSAAYDTNIYQSSFNEQDDAMFAVTPSVFYTTDPEGGAPHVITAYYSPSYQTYFDNSSLGRLNHSGGASYSWKGAKTTVDAFLSIAQGSQSDRLTSGYSEGTVFNFGVAASYQVAPRTRIRGSLSSSYSDYQTAGQSGGDDISANLGFQWSATERLNFGPSLRYTTTSGSTSGERDALALLFNVNYVVTERIDFYASLGLEYEEYSRAGGGSDFSPTGSLGLSYQLNEYWHWSASIANSYIPAPSTVGYVINDWTIQTSLGRALFRGSLRFGAQYSFSQYEASGLVAGPPGDDDYYSLFVGYSRPILRDRASLFTSLEYSKNSGRTSWSRWYLMTGLSYQF